MGGVGGLRDLESMVTTPVTQRTNDVAVVSQDILSGHAATLQ